MCYYSGAPQMQSQICRLGGPALKAISYLVASFMLATSALAQLTAFTYQGELGQDGAPANGTFDLRFRVYDSASGGMQMGPTVCVDNVSVVNGKFVALVDAGQQYSGIAARYLELDVRADTGQSCVNATGFTTLSPRQQLTPAPRAAAASVANALAAPDASPASAVVVDNDGKVGVGTAAPTAMLHVVGGDILAGVAGDEWLFHTRASFGGDFLQITDSENGVFHFDRGIVIHENGNIGIGLTNPASRFDVLGSARVRGPLVVDGSVTVGQATRTLTIHGSAFVASDPSATGFTYDARGVRYTGGLNGQEFWAPVNLPQGANITEVKIAFVDNVQNNSRFITAGVGRTNFSGGTLQFATVDSSIYYNSTDVREWATTTIDFPTVDNTTHSYWARATIPGTSSEEGRLVSMRITYTVTSPLP